MFVNNGAKLFTEEGGAAVGRMAHGQTADVAAGAGLTDRHLFDIIEHMRTIGGLELDVLLAVARSQGPAYGLSVRDEVGRARGREYSVGAIYTTLARLEDKGLIAGRSTEPLPVRGGRSRREYGLTTAAREVLAAERERSARRWDTEPHSGQA
jgi:PadR family transcriptional regulator, regulatory protein PadR